MTTLERVSLGLRAHSGWAVLVALGGRPSAPVVVDRRRLVLCDGSFPRQPYHAAESLPAAKAEALVGRSLDTARRLGREELRAAVEGREAAGQRIAGAGLLLGSGRPLPGQLAAILGSHPLIHTAEGEMYRDVLRAACEHAGVEVTGLRERGLEEAAGPRLKLAADALRARLAALAAWLVLQAARR